MIRLKEHKYHQDDLRSQRFLNPQVLLLPLSQHTGKPSVCQVKIGQEIDEAQAIAVEDGFISARLHSPSKGKVISLDKVNHPNLKRAAAVTIQCITENKRYRCLRDPAKLEREGLLEIIKDKGIVGMGGAAFPSYVKLKPPVGIDTLIINGCECEPFLTTDYCLMLENLKEIFLGIEIISRIIKPKRIIFAIEENKKGVLKQLNLFVSMRKFNLPQIKSAVLKARYPQGGEKQLIYALTGRKVNSGKLPFDTGCLVHNVATCFAVYEAVYLDKPLIERLVSFCGDGLKEPKNVWVKIGTTLSELLEKKIIELKQEPKKIICGGPMMGVALAGLDYPVLKGTGGFIFLSKIPLSAEETPCLKCGRCVDTCPMNLLPLEYARAVKKEAYSQLESLSLSDCIECGCCAYVCPAKIPLTHYIKTGKYYVAKSK
ncbi:MAG: electron transport complex subunit RsxC [Candidatus Omnitrophica bacterium]|nr:electron transport complex subunit RsxC [Candidatus Omnitrophota bacterium]MDD5429710.1 electron transport complex subunit RsxC [Candidatus Omnitrophota bacterium]